MPEINKKIAIVGDDQEMKTIIIHKLSTSGFTVIVAKDGQTGLDLIINERPSLVLLDLLLPEIDGFALLDQIRNHPDKIVADIPIIVISSLWSNKDILKTKSYHVDAYMVKAYFTTEEILKKVNEILSNPNRSKPSQAQLQTSQAQV